MGVSTAMCPSRMTLLRATGMRTAVVTDGPRSSFATRPTTIDDAQSTLPTATSLIPGALESNCHVMPSALPPSTALWPPPTTTTSGW